jgi:BCCT family betaine/carnitine transporter
LKPNSKGSLFGYQFDINNTVFGAASMMIVTFVIFTITFQDAAELIFLSLRNILTNQLGWLLIIVANIILVSSIIIAVSPLGKIRLGGDDRRPTYSYGAWFSMLFAAGMGIGLLFYGVAEPLAHFQSSITGTIEINGIRTDFAPLAGAGGNRAEAQNLAMAATFFHWALHPWSIYAMMALSFALTSFNLNLPLTVRSIFYPIFGEKIWGWPGDMLDVLAIFATMFGLATSLGLGASQTASGIEHLLGIPNTTGLQLILIVFITGLATCSVVLGLDKGVKRLSEINLGLASLLLLFILFLGPTYYLITVLLESIWAYVIHLPALSTPLGRDDQLFSTNWTAFYLSWWISWSPFVGIFIARISIGRTVREFMTCVLLAPTLGCMVWMTVFGGSAIALNANYPQIGLAEVPLQLFVMLEQLPLTELTTIVSIFLSIVFFVTSSDSGSMVIDSLASNGNLKTPVPQRIFWCGLGGAVAAALVLGGGLVALQAMAISTGLPFAVVLLLGGAATIYNLIKIHSATKQSTD